MQKPGNALIRVLAAFVYLHAVGRSGPALLPCGISLAAARLGNSEQCVVRRPLVDGDVDDWDVVEELWDCALSRMKSKAADHPVLAAVPNNASPELRESRGPAR